MPWLLGLHSRQRLCAPQKLFMPPPPQSCYSDAGPGDTTGSILYDHAKYVVLL